MSPRPLDTKTIDVGAYRDADAHFRMVAEVLPPDSLEDLAREVVRRLAFRMPQKVEPEVLPTDEEIETLCDALLSTDDIAGEQIIFAARRDGIPPETIYLTYVADAARKLGTLWEEDRVSFMDVTLASGRLYRIIRGLRHVIDPSMAQAADDRHVLFALVPGETHTLGIEIASDVFRRRGWDVDVVVGEHQDAIVERVEQFRYAAVVLIANSEVQLASLVATVLSLRISQPLATVVVAGNIVEQVVNVDKIVGADAVLPHIETAVKTLSDVIRAS